MKIFVLIMLVFEAILAIKNVEIVTKDTKWIYIIVLALLILAIIFQSLSL